MPPLHRYLGNPILTAIGRLFFGSKCRDFHCGLRGFNRDAILSLHLDSPGMEFASEMVVKATIFKLRIAEVPTTLSPDGRNRPPHLRSWRDGWRHLRLLLLFSPRWLFLYPGLAIFLLGLTGTLILLAGDFAVGDITFEERTMVITAAGINVGFQAMLFWIVANTIGIQRGFLPHYTNFVRFRRMIHLERGLALGTALILLGFAAFIGALFEWSAVGFGPLIGGKATRWVIISGTTVMLGTQVLYGSFLLYVLEYRAAAGAGRSSDVPSPLPISSFSRSLGQ